jgi:hypothetical protein
LGETNIPAGLGRASAIAASANFSVALNEEGSVFAWGYGPEGETNVPPSAKQDVAAIAAGYYHVLALRKDGTIVGWGDDATGENDIPANATNIIAIAAGGQHSLALRRDGSIVSWGSDLYGQNEVPVSATNITAISDSLNHCLALRADGTVITWGYLDGSRLLQVPARATNVVGIVAIDTASIALRADGSVVTWGVDPFGDVSLVPANATNVVKIAAGGDLQHDFCLALKADGSVVGWGENSWGQSTAPNDLNSVNLPYALTGNLNPYAVGTYTLTYTATNILGDIGTATRTVVVVDTMPPQVICPTNIVVEMAEVGGAKVSFASEAVDLCSGTAPVTCDPSSGSMFSVGTTVVVCTAVDDSGNTDQCSFSVSVLGLYSTKTNVLAEMRAASPDGIPLLDQAMKKLAKSLTAEWWTGELRLTPKFGRKVFTAESETVRLLQALERKPNTRIPAAQVRAWIDRLAKVDRLLAEVQIEDAGNGSASNHQLADAMESLSKGDRLLGKNRNGTGILYYGQAWARAGRVSSKQGQALGVLKMSLQTVR